MDTCVWGVLWNPFLLLCKIRITVKWIQSVAKINLFPVSVSLEKSLIFGSRAREFSRALWSGYELRARGTIIIIASDCLSELLICMTLTKCHYLLQREFTEGILKKSEIYLCRNNYLLSSGDEVIITAETPRFNLTSDQHGHASVSSSSISMSEAVMEGITI